jgi:hypothetical protein
VPWLLVKGQRKMLTNFAMVIGVTSVSRTWLNKQLPDVPLSHNNHKIDPQNERCIHLLCGQDWHNSCKKVRWVQLNALL